jgi:hypothetical protein
MLPRKFRQTWPPQAILVSDWLISKKLSPLKLLDQMNRKLVGSIYGRSSINNAHFVQLPVVAMFINRWELNAQSLWMTFQGCFLPSFDSFGQAVTENIFRNQPIRNKNVIHKDCAFSSHLLINMATTGNSCF